jgi:hypothetical protein
MEPSKQSREILKLGNKLVAELNAAGIDDVLSTWMAHHLAESINRAEKAPAESKAELESECVDLILKLWANRATLPRRARPLCALEPAATLLKHIAQKTDGHWERYINGQDNPLGKFGAAVDEGHKRIIGLLMFLQSVDIDFVDVKKWASDHGTLLSIPEKSIITNFDKVVEQTAYYYGFKEIRENPEAAGAAVFKAIERQVSQIRQAYDDLIATLEKIKKEENDKG